MLPVLQVGPLAIQTPGLMYLLGLWLGLSLAEKHAPAHGLSADQLYTLVFTALVAGLVGARLAYALQYPDAFSGTPISLVSLNAGLLDPFGGLATALLAALIYGQRKKLAFWPTLDALAPVLGVFMIGVALAHIASGEAFGAVANVPWSINLWGAHRHPSQFYELGASALTLFILWKWMQTESRAGTLFVRFIALTAGWRLFLEAFRGDSTLLVWGVREAQVIAWFVLAVALILLEWLRSQPIEA